MPRKQKARYDITLTWTNNHFPATTTRTSSPLIRPWSCVSGGWWTDLWGRVVCLFVFLRWIPTPPSHHWHMHIRVCNTRAFLPPCFATTYMTLMLKVDFFSWFWFFFPILPGGGITKGGRHGGNFEEFVVKWLIILSKLRLTSRIMLIPWHPHR